MKIFKFWFWMIYVLAFVVIHLWIWIPSVSAEVVGKIVGYGKDDNGNIVVIAEYKINGEKVVSRYPDGNWRTRYNSFNFSKDKVAEDVKSHCETLVYQTYNTKANDGLLAQQDEMGTTNPDKITTVEYKTSTTIRKMDTDGDGILDLEITLKDDGTKTEKLITE